MSLFNTAAIWRRIFKGVGRKQRTHDSAQRLCRFEQMEPRQLMTATPPQIHLGSVFFDPAPGSNTTPNTIQITFQGGTPNTQLTQLVIDGSKNQLGPAVGDIVWEPAGGSSQAGQSPLTVVSHSGFTVVSQTALNGGSQIMLTLSGFVSGDKLVLTDNAEKITAIDPNTQAITVSPLTKGNDFQSAHLIGTFVSPHYENLTVNTGYVAGFDVLFAQNNATAGVALDLPTQNYMPPSNTDQSNQTTGANVLVTQTPLPISIGGTVFSDPNLNNNQDAGEPGLANVTLTLFESNGAQFVSTGLTTTTDANGNYLFQFLQPGTYQVGETVPGGYYAVGAASGTVSGNPDGSVVGKTVVSQVALLGGDDSIENNFALAQAANISGYVYHDTNNNGLREAGEQGLGGVTIVATPVSTLDGSTTPLTTITAADGSYSFTGLAPGQYTVTETTQPAGYLDGKVTPGSLGGTVGAIGDQINTISLLGGQSGTEYDFGKRLPASLSGNVADCLTETPLAGVTVNLLDSNGNVLTTTTTDENGNYQFNGLTPGGIYGVSEILPTGYMHNDEDVGSVGGTIAANASIVQIALGDGTNGTGYNFCDVRPASIAGNVDDCLTNTPLAGVTVQLLGPEGNVLQTTTTNAQGNYQFTNLTPGETYGVAQVLPTGYMFHDEDIGSAGGTIVNTAITQVALGDGVSATGYNFCDVLPASISGSVADCLAGVPLSGVTVNLLDGEGNVLNTTTTNAQGNYQFTNLMPGQTYGVTEILPTGYMHNDETVGSAGGAISNFAIIQVSLGDGVAGTGYNFCDVKPTSISGTVADCLADQPLSGVTVNLLDSGGNILQSTTTNEQGQYSFTNLTPGKTYGVSEVLPAGYMHNDETVGSAGGTIANFSIVQVALGDGVAATGYDFCDVLPASLSGSVADCSAGIPLSGVTVNLLDAGGNVLATTTTDESGNYQFNGLKPGVTYGVSEVLPTGYLHNDETIGNAGGLIVNDVITQVTLGDGVNSTDNDFCDYKPISISGVVHIDTTGDCDTAVNLPTLAGVTIELLDSDGNVLSTTVTGAQGQYSFGNLKPDTYSVLAVQPNGYFSEDADTGTISGVTVGVEVGDNETSQITFVSGQTGINYNFCVEPPGTISGFVFQDGPPISLPQGTTLSPSQVSLYRDGVFQPSDKRLGGITLYLGDGNGQIILDDNLQPISVVTDATGFYQFTNLKAGDYTVLEQLPDSQPNVIAGLITAGSAGGVALNAGATISPSIIAELAIPGSSTAIVEIPLAIGANSMNNNFSVVVTDTPQSPPPPVIPNPPPQIPPVEIPPTPQLAFNPLISPITFVPPNPPPAFEHFTVGGAGDDEYTWHLSIIDGGAPRESDEPGQPQFVPAGFNVNSWNGVDLTQSQWTVNDGNGDPKLRYVFGTPGAIPISGDFTGDGTTRMGVFIDGEWFIDMNGNGVWDAGDMYCKLGGPGDTPVVGDWDGDGKDDIGVFGPAWSGDPKAINREPGLPKPHNPPSGAKKNHPPAADEAAGERTMKVTSRGKLRADVIDHVFQFGHHGDIPVTGDWTGSGVKTIGIFHDGTWFLDTNGDGHFGPDDVMAHFGQAGDIPVVGDWDGSGRDSIGVFRNGTWILDSNHSFQQDPSDEVRHLGSAGDKPVVGDWTGTGHAQIGVYHNGALEKPDAK